MKTQARVLAAIAVTIAMSGAAYAQNPPAAAPGPAPVPAPTAPRAGGAASAAAKAGAAAAPSAAALDADQYRIGPEDALEISIWKNPDLTRTVVVRPDGRISLPLLNDLQAAGQTPLQLRDALIKGYAAFQPEPEVSVIVKEIHSVKVSVLGGVKNPGRYELKSQATVLEALAMAGGLTDFAKRDQILIFRRNGRTTVRLPFNYSRVIASGEEENFFLQPSDIIVVPN